MPARNVIVHNNRDPVPSPNPGKNKLKPETKHLKGSQTHPGARKISRSTVSGLVKTNVPKLGSLTAPIGQFADPVSYRPTRLPDVTSLSSAGTAVASLSVVDTLHWPLECLGGTEVPSLINGPVVADPLNRLVVVLRDPIVMAVVEDSSLPISVGTSIYRLHSPKLWSFLPQDDFAPAFTHVYYVSGAKRYGDWQPVAHNAGVQGFWLDANTTWPAYVDIAGMVNDDYTMSGSEIKVQLVRHVTDGVVEDYARSAFTLPAYTNPFTVPTINVTASGYYSLTLTATAPASGVDQSRTLTLTGVVTLTTQIGLVHRHIVHPDIAASDGKIVQDIRVLGAAFLASNVTAEFFKGGSVYAKQIPQRVVWYENCATPTDLTSANVRLMYDGPLEKGFYGFVKPQGLDSLSMNPAVDLVTDASKTLVSTSYQHYLFKPFSVPGAIQVLFCPPDTTASTNSAACTLLVHFTRSMEFQTSSQLLSVESPELTREALLQIMDALDRLPQFYENPLHWSQIRAALERAGKFVWNNRALIAQIVTYLATLG